MMAVPAIRKTLVPLLAALAVALSAGSAAALSGGDAARAAALAAGYLIKSQHDDGFFDYQFDFLRNRYSTKDNIVRQTGAGAVLAEYYLATGDRRVAPALVAALEGFAAKSILVGDGKVVARGGTLRSARSGATALALLTELRYFQATGDNRFAAIRHLWRDGLLAVRMPGGGFREYPGADKELTFFNGEIWLALAEYHRMFPEDAAVAEVLPDLDKLFMARYGAEEKSGFFLWGLQAAEVRHASGAGAALHHYAVEKVRFYLDKRRPKFRETAMHCASMEGLMAVWTTLLADDPANAAYGDLTERLGRRIKREMAKHVTFQIQPGQTRIAYDDGVYVHSDRLPEFAGAFLNGRYEIKARVDFTWHCLSSLVKYGLVVNAEGYRPRTD